MENLKLKSCLEGRIKEYMARSDDKVGQVYVLGKIAV